MQNFEITSLFSLHRSAELASSVTVFAIKSGTLFLPPLAEFSQTGLFTW